MSYREQLASAVASVIADGWRCIECGNPHVYVTYLPALDEVIPDSAHWAASPEDCCPVLRGGVAAWACHEDLWAALEQYLPAPDYGAESWARAEPVNA